MCVLYMHVFVHLLTVGIFLVCFRMQIDKQNEEFKEKHLESAFAEYCVACIFLFFVAITYVG